MSSAQRNDACLVTVDREVGAVLRHQTLVVLEANHHAFEDVLLLGTDARRALSAIYRDAFAVLDAVGWGEEDARDAADVPLTAGHLEQLARRRLDLGHTNIDRLELDGPAVDRAALTADRRAAEVLDGLRVAFARARRG
jgi:hypothetical protein